MYTIMQLSELAGVSTRTLRYYDEIQLLKPSKVTDSGYRLYDDQAVDKLQHILFYKALGLPLKDISQQMNASSFDELTVLHEHYEKLMNEQNRLTLLINTVRKTIESKKGEIIMKDHEKFEGLKEQMIKENDERYGEELKATYDESFYKMSQEKVKNMSQWQFNEATRLGQAIINQLIELVDTEKPNSEAGLALAKLHHEWLMFYWPSYSKEAHAGVALMYISDERFTNYYDKHKKGAAQFLYEAVTAYTSI